MNLKCSIDGCGADAGLACDLDHREPVIDVPFAEPLRVDPSWSISMRVRPAWLRVHGGPLESEPAYSTIDGGRGDPGLGSDRRFRGAIDLETFAQPVCIKIDTWPCWCPTRIDSMTFQRTAHRVVGRPDLGGDRPHRHARIDVAGAEPLDVIEWRRPPPAIRVRACHSMTSHRSPHRRTVNPGCSGNRRHGSTSGERCSQRLIAELWTGWWSLDAELVERSVDLSRRHAKLACDRIGAPTVLDVLLAEPHRIGERLTPALPCTTRRQRQPGRVQPVANGAGRHTQFRSDRVHAHTGIDASNHLAEIGRRCHAEHVRARHRQGAAAPPWNCASPAAQKSLWTGSPSCVTPLGHGGRYVRSLAPAVPE